MTFSIVGHCARTGMFGVAITTSSICVGARCPHARARVGAVATQNVTDPELGPIILDYLQRGDSAEDALERTLEGRVFTEYRQLLVIDRRGNTATHTGDNILGTNATVRGNNCVAAGNLLKSVGVPHAMADAFATNEQQHLAERLLRSLEAGIAAGGEEGPVHSAALLVADDRSFPLVDLRVDWADDGPDRALRRLWTDYEPQMNAYRTRAINPAEAPTYGVPGDE